MSEVDSLTVYRGFFNFSMKRIIHSVIVLFGVTLVVFLIFRVLPGDVESSILGPYPTPEAREFLRNKWGLDKPLWEQYFIFLSNLLLEFDLGTSYQKGISVTTVLLDTLPATLELALTSILLGVLVGLFLGVLSAYYFHTKIDYRIIYFTLHIYT